MDFTIKNIDENAAMVARKIGYLIIDAKGNGEYNLVRKLTLNNYPRFHIYLKQQGRPAGGEANNYLFDLHLDQKQPSYGGSHAHSGEYFGPVLEEEADRIRELLAF